MTTPTTPQEEIAALKRELELLREEELRAKRVEYYSASIGAWFNTSQEFDKSMFALSGGGIALLVSVMSNVKTLTMFLLFIGACVSFIVTAGVLLAVFQKNKPFLKQLAQNEQADSSLLVALDATAKIFFGLGVVLTVILGIAMAMQNLNLTNCMR
jgi:hypothetical protein